MELNKYTVSDLKDLYRISQAERDMQMVRKIVFQVHSNVIYNAKRGLTTYLWEVDQQGKVEFELRHIVVACQELRTLFPDAIITRPTPSQILVDWL